MPSSTLDPANIPGKDRQLGKGHGIDSLGPSDLSDTGSDVQGGLSITQDEDLGLERGTNEDSDSHPLHASRDTSDSGGTGESSTAGRNRDVDINGDIGFDRVDYLSMGEESGPGLGNDDDPDLDDIESEDTALDEDDLEPGIDDPDKDPN